MGRACALRLHNLINDVVAQCARCERGDVLHSYTCSAGNANTHSSHVSGMLWFRSSVTPKTVMLSTEARLSNESMASPCRQGKGAIVVAV